MVVSNLPVVMAQKRIFTLQEVFEKTNISRSTLSSLYHGKVKGIRFDTLDKLCELLECDVGELLQRVSKKQ